MASSTLIVLAAVVVCVYSDYIHDSLDSHNALRAKHHSPPLELDDTLNKKARKCVKYYMKQQKIDHTCPYKDEAGENLAWAWSSAGPPSLNEAAKNAVNGWYAEENNYNYSNPGNESKGATGHFTQLVWKKSTTFGMASLQDAKSGTTYTTALYGPRGNIHRRGKGDSYQFFRENVLAP